MKAHAALPICDIQPTSTERCALYSYSVLYTHSKLCIVLSIQLLSFHTCPPLPVTDVSGQNEVPRCVSATIFFDHDGHMAKIMMTMHVLSLNQIFE